MTIRFAIFLLLLSVQAVAQNKINLDSLLLRLEADRTNDAATVRRMLKAAELLSRRNLDSAAMYLAQSETLTHQVQDRYLDAEYLLVQGVFLIAAQKVDTAKFVLEQAILKSSKCNDKLTEAKANSNLGACAFSKGEYDQAKKYYQKAYDLAIIAKDNYLAAGIRANMGNILDMQGEKQKAISSYTDALLLFEKQGDINSIGVIHHNIGAIYSNLGDQNKAILHTNTAIAAYDKAGNTKSKVRALLNLAFYYKESDKLDSADLAIRLVDGQTVPLNDQQKSLMLVIKAHLAFKQFQYHAAILHADSAISYGRKVGSMQDVHNGLATKAQSFVALKFNDKAIIAAKEALRIAESLSDPLSIMADQKILADGYGQAGRYNDAYQFLSAYQVGRDSFFTTERIQAVHAVEVKYETEKKDLLLVHQRSLIKSGQAKTWALSLALALALCVLGLLYKVAKDRKHKLETQLELSKALESKAASEQALKEALNEKLELEQDLNESLSAQNASLQNLNDTLSNELAKLKSKDKLSSQIGELSITLPNKEKTIVKLKDMISITSRGNLLIVSTTTGKYEVWQSLSSFEALLNDSQMFIRTHRTYLVNWTHISKREANQLTMSDGTVCQIASTLETRVSVNDHLDKKLFKM